MISTDWMVISIVGAEFEVHGEFAKDGVLVPYPSSRYGRFDEGPPAVWSNMKGKGLLTYEDGEIRKQFDFWKNGLSVMAPIDRELGKGEKHALAVMSAKTISAIVATVPDDYVAIRFVVRECGVDGWLVSVSGTIVGFGRDGSSFVAAMPCPSFFEHRGVSKHPFKPSDVVARFKEELSFVKRCLAKVAGFVGATMKG